MGNVARHEGARARPARTDLLADLEGKFSAQHVHYFIAVAVEMEQRFGAGWRDLLEYHDTLPSLQALQLERGRSSGGYVPHRLLTRKRYDPIRLGCHLLILLSRKMCTPHKMRGLTPTVSGRHPTTAVRFKQHPQNRGASAGGHVRCGHRLSRFPRTAQARAISRIAPSS